MKAYKGFNKDMTCRGFRYEEGKSYHEDKAELCEKGFHGCEYPLDCFTYYSPARSVYHEAEIDGLDDSGDNRDSKVCGTDIRIGRRLDVAGLIKASFDYIKNRCTSNESGGYQSALTGGYQSALTGGYWSALTGGNRSALRGGDWSALRGGNCSALTGGAYSALRGGNCSALRGGNYSALAGGAYSALRGGVWSALTGGNWSALTGGDCSALTGGNWSALTGGNWSALTGGDWSALRGGDCSALTGGKAAIMRGGPQSKFKGSLWSVFACEIRDDDNNLTGMATAVVDGENIKPDVWYECVDGEFAELED